MRAQSPNRVPLQGPRSQHFLRTPAIARGIVAEARLRPGDLVFEPGAGSGMLTRALAETGCRVIAVEKDPRLHRSLRARFLGRTNVECHLGDVMAFPLPRGPYRVVANLPFGITSAFVRRMLTAARPPDEAWLIVQREAALKFAGAPRETMFSLLQKPRFSFEVARRLPRLAFVPPPAVDVALLHIALRPRALVPAAAAPAYERFVRAGFRSGAADARTALRPYLTRRQLQVLSREHGFAPSARPSELRFEQWLAVFRFAASMGSTHDPWRRLRMLAASPKMRVPSA